MAGERASESSTPNGDYLRVHAQNLERAVAHLRATNRALAERVHELQHREAYWKGRHDAVVRSWTWRASWLLLTPYRAWVAFRTRHDAARQPK